MSDEPRIDLCACHGFRLWYHEQDRVCRCGHRDTEHLDGRGSCTGEIEVLPATAPAAIASAGGGFVWEGQQFRCGGFNCPCEDRRPCPDPACRCHEPPQSPRAPAETPVEAGNG